MLKLFLSALFTFIMQLILAQENGVLFLSDETLNKSAYSYEIDQYRLEHSYPERFSNNAWKYHPGDDLNWKETSFDDRNWTLFRTDFNLDSISNGEWQGIGWFRLKIIIDSSLYNQALALVMTHYGASETYFDGKLMNQFGVPSQYPETEITFRPLFLEPVILPLDNKPEHLLAVRYSFQQANKLIEKYRWKFSSKNDADHVGSIPGFTVHFGKSKQAINLFGASLHKNFLFAIITFTALFLIGCFHIFLFLFYSRDFSNFYLAIYNLTVAGFSYTLFRPTYASLSLQEAMLNSYFIVTLDCLWMPVSMLAYYSVFYKKLPRHVWLYFIAAPLMAYEWFHNFYLFSTIQTCLYIVVFLDMMRLFIKSVIKKERNSWIIGVGVLLSQSTLMAYLKFSTSTLIHEFLVYPILLAVPVSLLIFNAIRTAGTNISLEKQLVEVKRLSELSRVQEQEKHQILTSQKKRLEQKVQERTAELSQTLENLKSTQDQLIQSAKMASLGELTAGIAHEIQNPLNFVNNFSEVNSELLDEMKNELQTGKIDEAITLSDEVIQNNEKIVSHGKRADSIVKGMLQHSRSSSGIKEPTDINALADEYFRLSYHGMKAKDKSFHATMKSAFDPSIGKINVIPQDIGRVLLNLINNAFYAVNERSKEAVNGYEPEVTVSTRLLTAPEHSTIRQFTNSIIISVKDNGMGIPEKVLDKIFQPFFTTKPAGQGMGLGLSLSYDIIKAHGGEIKVETKEGEGSEFIILLNSTFKN